MSLADRFKCKKPENLLNIGYTHMDQIAEIKQKLDIVDIVGGYVSLKKSGRNYKGVCPFHAEDTPSFMVSPELQIFKCFGCNEGGDVFSFIQKIEGIDFPRALEKLADRAGIVLEKRALDPNLGKKKILYELNHLTSEFYHYLLTKHAVGKVGLEYLKGKRGLTDRTIKDFMLGYAPQELELLYKFLTKKKYKPEDILSSGLVIARSGGDYVDRFRGRIVFTFTGLDGKIVGFTGRTIFDENPKYMNTPETLVFHKGSTVYALDKAKMSMKKEGAVFVEGNMDVISAHQHGLKNVVAVSGTSLTTDQLKLISRYTNDLTFCFDSDTAGDAAAHRAISMAEALDFNIRALLIPQGYKDLDEYLVKNPKETKNILNDAIPVYDFFLVSALKRNDKKQAIGKKIIMQELAPIFGRIRNLVTLDHYIKRISKELDLKEDTVLTMFKTPLDVKNASTQEFEASSFIAPKRSPQEYILALLMKAPLDTAQSVLYKLGQEDFPDDNIKNIFSTLKSYLTDLKGSFRIGKFIPKLDENLRSMAEDLYLWDLEHIISESRILTGEIDRTFERVKKERIRGELRELSEKISQAELEKDSSAVKKLSEKFKNLSEKLI